MSTVNKSLDSLDEIDVAIPKVVWKRVDGGPQPAVSYQGEVDGQKFTIVSWQDNGRTFYDGALVKGHTVTRLTFDQAERAFKLAMESKA